MSLPRLYYKIHCGFYLGYSFDLSWIIDFGKTGPQVLRTFRKFYGEVHMVKENVSELF